MNNMIKSFRYVKENYYWREIWIVGLLQTVDRYQAMKLW